MIKIILCVIVTALTTLTTHELYKSEHKKLKFVKELYTVTEEIIGLLRFQYADVYQICEQCFKSRKIAFNEFCKIKANFTLEWQKACKSCLNTADSEASKLFEEIGTVLGNYDLQTQISRLEYILQSLKDIHKAKEVELGNKRKIYYTFGICSGVIICLFII